MGTFLRDRRLARLVMLAALLRLAIVVASQGSNDVFAWAALADLVRDRGIIGAYDATAAMNHPPLAGLYMACVLSISDTLGVPFAWLVKLPGLGGEALIALSIWHVVLGRTADLDRARRVTIAYLFNPVTILIAAYHGNTDLLYVGLVFAAVVALDRQRPTVAGALFVASMNVKMLPVAFGAALLSVLWRHGGWLRFAAGATAASVPALLIAARAPSLVWSRTLGYQRDMPEAWGFTGLEMSFRTAVGSSLDTIWYYANGRTLFAAGLILAAVIAHRRRFDTYRTFGLAAAALLVLAPGFGVQYLAVAVPFLFVADLRAAQLYTWVGGSLLVVAYGSTLTGGFPAASIFTHSFGDLTRAAGALSWCVCIWVLAVLTSRSGSLVVRPHVDQYPDPMRTASAVAYGDQGS